MRLTSGMLFGLVYPLLVWNCHWRKMLSCSTCGRMYTFHELPQLPAAVPNGGLSDAHPGGSFCCWSW